MFPEYQILLAPFYYIIGNVTSTYIENKTDVFGALPKIDFEESQKDEDEEGEELEDP
jgi:hypothetical protein